jgi:hypothetical protein
MKTKYVFTQYVNVCEWKQCVPNKPELSIIQTLDTQTLPQTLPAVHTNEDRDWGKATPYRVLHSSLQDTKVILDDENDNHVM